jgi:hypothetical protein
VFSVSYLRKSVFIGGCGVFFAFLALFRGYSRLPALYPFDALTLALIELAEMLRAGLSPFTFHLSPSSLCGFA